MIKIKRLHEPEWEKNLLKKYKITKQISICLSSKINNKIYCHHDDDSYVENKMTIDHVNDDCLAEIFMYVPACERPKIALVCKQWKRVLDDYSWFNVKKLELTHWEYDEHPNYLIKNYPTFNGQFNFLKSLLNKSGRYLTELDVTAYDHCNIVPVINESCPNLVKLLIRIKYIDDAILDNAFTGLSKLKVLKIIFQCFPNPGTYIPVTLINSLLNVADTLTELTLSNWPKCRADNSKFPEEFISVITELKALKKFQTAGINYSKSIISHILLRNPQVIARYDECKYDESKIGRTRLYDNIKNLTIRQFRVTDDFLYNVANVMRQLHTLHIHGHFISDAGIVAISKMNCLRTLFCYGDNEVTDSSIKLLKNLLAVNLPMSNKITDKSAIKVLENSPELRQIGVSFTGVSSEFIKKAEEISRNRKKQLRVFRTFEDGMSNRQIKYEYLTVDYILNKRKKIR